MDAPEDKSKRLRERVKLTLPARVTCREAADYEWAEMMRLNDVTPFGAGFKLTRPTEPGRLLHLVLPMPRQLRSFDHAEDQYRVWALVRHVSAAPPEQSAGAWAESRPRFEVGVGFTGKHPPPSYRDDPTILYDADALAQTGGLLTLREREKCEVRGRGERSEATRLQMAVPVAVEVFDQQNRVCERETTITENVSRRGAAILTTLAVGRGRFI